MSLRRTLWTVFIKELTDAMRDRRTLLVVLLTSVAMGPLLLVAISGLVGGMEKRAEAREIVVVGLDAAPTLRNFLERQTYAIKAAPANWEALLHESKLGDPVLVVPSDFEVELAHGETPRLALVYSSSDSRSQGGVGRVSHLMQGFSQEQATLRLIARGVAPSALSVLQVDEHDVADSAARALQFTNMLPYFVLMAVVYGALNAAMDTTAGERERGSLEPLLATPAARSALVIGKWGAVFAVGLLIAVLSCLSFIPAQRLLRSETLSALFRFGPYEAIWFIGLLAPLAAAVSALMMAIAIRCKSFKEAQANNNVVVLGLSLMPLFGILNQEGEAAWHLWLPPLAQTTLMGRVLKGAPLAALDVAPAFLVCTVITVLSLVFVSRQLARSAAQ